MPHASSRTRHVCLAAVLAAVLTLPPVGTEPGHAEITGRDRASPGARAALPQSNLVQFAGGTIAVEFDPSRFIVSRAEMHDWVRASARATAAYFGRFPVTYARLVIEPVPGDEVVMGYALGHPEPRIVVKIGTATTARELAGESLLVHEMVHLAVPDHDPRFLWLHEGIATYVENVARAQVKQIGAAEMWAEFVREMPEGLPRGNDPRGLDGTSSEQRRYWGGALFCLVADIEIRRASGNRLGLQDALREVQRRGGSLARLWTIEDTLNVADEASGTAILSRLYRQMGPRAHAPDLALLWAQLGVDRSRGEIVFDDRAPLAHIRRAITDQPSAPLLITAPRLLRVAVARGGAAR